MALLWEEIARQTFLPILIPHELQVYDWPALVGSYPYGADAGELDEAIGEVVELVAGDIEDGEAGEGGEGVRERYKLVVAQGEDREGSALPNLST